MPIDRIEHELRGRARELIHTGQLPDGRPTKMWGGGGSDLPCVLCERPIPRGELEYELMYRTPEGERVYRFHFYCHTAWQLECARRETSNARA